MDATPGEYRDEISSRLDPVNKVIIFFNLYISALAQE